MTSDRIERRSPCDRLAGEVPALDEAVDDRGDRRLGDREALGEQRRAFVAGGDQREDAVLGEREVAPARGPLERPRREGQRPGGAVELGIRHRTQDTEPLEPRTISGNSVARRRQRSDRRGAERGVDP